MNPGNQILAKMISTPAEFIELMHSKKPSDRHRLRHDSAPLEVWRELISNYPCAKQWVALNKTSPVEILMSIARDTDAGVRSTVAGTRRITTDIQEILANDPESRVRNSMANNAKAADWILELLARDSEAFVRQSAYRGIEKRRAKKEGTRHPNQGSD